MSHLHPTISTAARFRKAEAQADARSRNIPHCPLKPDAVIEHQGAEYAVLWHSYDGVSKTMKLYVDVYSFETGKRHTFDQIIFSVKRDRQGNGTVRYNLKGHKGWGSREAAQTALVALAAEQLRGLTLSNPVTGAVVIPFSYGGNFSFPGGAA